MRLRLALAALLAAASLPTTALAQQQWLSDRRFAEGIGIRVGDLELHPGVGVEGGYDSNYFQRSGENRANTIGDETVEDVYRLRIVPHLSLSTLGVRRQGANPGMPPMLVFDATAFAAYDRIFAADSDVSDDVNRGTLQLGVTLSGAVAPKRPFGADFHGNVVRVAEPSNAPELEFTFDRWRFNAGGGLAWRPGGGLFEWRAGYDFTYHYFEEERYNGYDNLQHQFQLQGSWKFLPRTALLYSGNYTLIRYNRDDALQVNGEVIRSLIGIRGLLTYRLALTGMIGWVASFYHDAPENGDTLAAHAEAKYLFMSPPTADRPVATTGLSSIALGYTRDMANAYLSSYYIRDRGYLNVNYMLAGAFVTSLEGGIGRYAFPTGEDYEAFDQLRLDARLFAEYRFSDTIALNGTLRYDLNASDTLRPRDADQEFIEDLDFKRFQGYIGVRWFM